MVEMLEEEPLQRVADFVDDDLLSCFLWAAGENAVAQPGWESPSVNPLKGIPLPPDMPPLPPASSSTIEPMGKAGRPFPDSVAMSMGHIGAPASTDRGVASMAELQELDEDDLADISNNVGGPLSKEQKLTQRMQRKAESARVARLRKKEYVAGLEQEIAKLKSELAAVREKGQRTATAGASEPPTLREEGERQLSQMGELLKRPQLENVVPEVNATVEKYVSNKRAQQATINEYLDCIEDILSPGAPLQVAFSPTGADITALSALDKIPSAQMLSGTPSSSAGPLAMALSSPLPQLSAVKDSAAIGSAAPAAGVKREHLDANGAGSLKNELDESSLKRQRSDSVGKQLLETLSVELGLSSAQVDQLSGQKSFISSNREMNRKCLQLLRELRGRIAEHVTASQGITDGLRRILTPVQVAKFLMWVERHQRSMDLLNTMLQADSA